MISSENPVAVKPKLRGYFHQEAFFMALGACILLVVKSSNSLSLISSLVYSAGLLILLGISSVYHRFNWPPAKRALLKRLDHSAIFILIAGTFTPLCLLALSESSGQKLFLVIWSAAILGVLQSVFWVKAPKIVTATFYVIMGWLAFPYIGELRITLGMTSVALMLAGGIVYTVGAVFYAFKKPNLIPGVLGYHELFHLFTIIGAGLHFAMIYQLIT